MSTLPTPFTLLLAIALTAGCMAAPVAADDERGYLLLTQADDVRVTADPSQAEQLKIAALEALMSAPPEKALPLVTKVLAGNHSDAVKSRALFVLGQNDTPQAQDVLLGIASDPGHSLQREAIRTIGIGGSPETILRLADIYRDGDKETRKSVLNAYLISGDEDAVYELARNANNEDDFDAAVRILTAMGATQKLRLLIDKTGDHDNLIKAYAMSGDLQSLQQLASSGDTEQRLRAISAMGIVGDEKANHALVDIYRNAGDEAIRKAALQGLLIGGHDEGVLALYRASQDSTEKRTLLRALVAMGSDLAFDVIDSALQDGGS